MASDGNVSVGELAKVWRETYVWHGTNTSKMPNHRLVGDENVVVLELNVHDENTSQLLYTVFPLTLAKVLTSHGVGYMLRDNIIK